MARHKNIPDLVINPQKVPPSLYHPRTRKGEGGVCRYKAVENHSDPSTYPVIPLCPVAACSQPLVRRDGLIVCSANPWHYTFDLSAFMKQTQEVKHETT